MDSLKVLKCFGVATLCYPIDSFSLCGGVSKNRVVRLATNFLQSALLVVVVGLHWDQYANHPKFQYDRRLSAKITLGLLHLSIILPFLIISTCSILFRHDILTLDRNLAFPPEQLSPISLQGKFLRMHGTMLSLLWFSLHSSSIFYYTLRNTGNTTCSFSLIPCNDIPMKTIIMFSILWPIILNFYAWNWITHYGVALVNRLETLMGMLEGAVLPQKDGIIQVRSSANGGRDVTSLLTEFQRIQASFAEYSKIGGAFGLAVLIYLVIQCIALMNTVINGITDKGWESTLINLYILACFPSLVTVVHFGSYVTQSVNKHCSNS